MLNIEKKFDCTTKARAFALRFPKLNHIAIQVNFWIFAFLFQIIIHLNSLSLIKSYSLQITQSLGPSVIISLIGGLIYGVVLGYVDILTERDFLKQKSWALSY